MAARADGYGAAAAAAVAMARVQARTALTSVLLGVYLLIMAADYGGSTYYYHSITNPFVNVSMSTAFVVHICHVAILYGIFVNKFLGIRRDLVYALCASLAVSMVTAPVTLVTLVCAIASTRYDVALWEMARLGGVLLHLSLVRRYLRELRGKRFVDIAFSSASSPSLPTPPPTPSSPPTPPPPPSPPPTTPSTITEAPEDLPPPQQT